MKRSLHNRGIVGSLLLIPRRYLQRLEFRKFDFGGYMAIHEMIGADEVKKHAVTYQATQYLMFKQLFDKIEWVKWLS